MFKFIILHLIVTCPIVVAAQTYSTSSQGGNYGNGGGYVAPIVTKTYTMPAQRYISSVPSFTSKTNNSNYSAGSNGHSTGSRQLNGGRSNVSEIESLESRTPTTAADFYYLGNSKYLDRDYEKAVQYYKKSAELNPGDAPSYLSIGLSKYKLNDYTGSIQPFNKAIEISPDYQQAYMGRADARFMLNDFDGAIEDYNKAIALLQESDASYTYATICYSRGLARYNNSDYGAAAEDFAKTIALCDETQKAWDAERQKEAKQHNSSKKMPAENAIREIEHEPMYAGAYYNKGSAKMHLKDLTGALEDFNKAIELDRDYAEAYYTRGLLHLVLGNRNSGCSDLNKASELAYSAATNVIKEYCK